ncbi:hypothetical protein Thiowin_03828 [Thiorhodovibrio winogradskyi]|uniref:ATPase AAA-type core domain-containing protein n=1 Tax=Thiorhodovibrio winogradskyi TaxID=77007 RepID=A0ABZ0SDN8_9GAMM|nr:hypothetical protein [Thiorhodovibrio winogradskyi]
MLLLDEVDALVGDTLISLVLQLHSGYMQRPALSFPHTLVLCGASDLRDYRIHAPSEFGPITFAMMSLDRCRQG